MADAMPEEWLTLEPLHPRAARRAASSTTGEADAVGMFITEQPGSALPRALVLHDSFGISLRPFLSEHFGHVRYLRRLPPVSSPLLEGVDIVIEEMGERRLYHNVFHNVIR